MKKDIVAVIIFLTTAVLVYMVQGHAISGTMASSEDTSGATEAVLVFENAPRPEKDRPSRDQRTWDS
jgi:hypothetical protein